MKKSNWLMALGLLLLIPPAVPAQEVLRDQAPTPLRIPSVPLPLPKVTPQDTRHPPRHTLDIRVGDRKTGLNRDFPRDPFLELQEAVQRVISGEVKDCNSVRGTMQQVERAILACHYAHDLARQDGKEDEAERLALRCESYGGLEQLNMFYESLLQLVCGAGGYTESECFSRSERDYYACWVWTDTTPQ